MKRLCYSFSFLVFLFIFLFLSCGTFYRVHGIEIISPEWLPLNAEIKGLDYFAGKIISPKLEFHALRVDLFDPQLEIFIAAGGLTEDGNAATSSSKTFSSIKTSTFVRINGLLAGINALPFEPSSSREGEARTNIGVVISNGLMLSNPHPKFDALVFYSDKSAAIIPQSEISPGLIENAVGGFYSILKDGKPLQRSETEERHPRSAAGISDEGRFLYLLAVDGRQAGSIGSTESETALILKALGAYDGINFDGGGSSTLALLYPDGKIRAANTPVHGGIPGRERAVAGCLGIRHLK